MAYAGEDRIRLANLLAVSIFLAGCATSASTVSTPAPGMARIRVFHGTAVHLYPNKTCYARHDKNRIRASMGGYSFLAKNKKRGMPVTDDLPWSYHEFEIRANEPLTVEMVYSHDSSHTGAGQVITQTRSCGPVGYTFVPEAGKDYDAFLSSRDGRCMAHLRELLAVGGGSAKAIPKLLSPTAAGPCAAP
jgi:hypothetical protein